MLQEVLNYSESLHPTLDLWDVNQLIAAIYASLRDDLELNRVQARLDLQPNLPLVKLDYKKISYCLRNIISNSLEAMPEGGRLEIATLQEGAEIVIRIGDDGPGMTPEMIREVTAPFFSTKEEGSGLGLSLCARILEGHAARFDIDSRQGRGTTFTIHLKTPGEEYHGTIAGS